MKKIVLALAFAAFVPGMASAAATAVCAAGAAANGTAITAGVNFIKAAVTPKCSANVHLSYDQNTTAFWVASGSSKGKNYFGGSTEGGAVANLGACAATGCTTGNITTAMTAVVTACGSACQ